MDVYNCANQPPRLEQSNSEVRYWAFISYSHKDNRKRRRRICWASWLQEGLETYPVPQDLRLEGIEFGRALPSSLYPVFRDETELPCSSHLSEKIAEALKSSYSLIVIASPNSASSPYVDAEVRFFQSLGRSDRVFALIIAGEPNVDARSVRNELECFCPALIIKEATAELQKPGQHNLPGGHIAADVRLKEHGQTREPLRSEMRRAQLEMHQAIVKLVAGILRVPITDLQKRDVTRLAAERTRRNRIKTLIALATTALTAAAVAALVFARDSRREATHTKSKLNLIQAIGLRDSGGQQVALSSLVQAIVDSPGDRALASALCDTLLNYSWALPVSSREYDIGSQAPVERTLASSKLAERFVTASSPIGEVATLRDSRSNTQIAKLYHESNIVFLNFSADGRMLISAQADGKVVKWDARSGAYMGLLFSADSSVRDASLDPFGKRIALLHNDQRLTVWDLASLQPLFKPLEHSSRVRSFLFLSDDRIVLISERGVYFWSALTGQWFRPPLVLPDEIHSAIISPDHKSILVRSRTEARAWEIETARPITDVLTHARPITTMSFDESGQLFVVASEDGTTRIWNSRTGAQVSGSYSLETSVDIARFSPGSTWLLTGSHENNAAEIWRLMGNSPIRQHLILPGSFDEFSFDKSGSMLTIQGSLEDGLFRRYERRWRLTNTRALPTVLAADSIVSAAKFFDSCRKVVTVTYSGIIQLWDSASGQKLAELQSVLAGCSDLQITENDSRTLVMRGELGAAVHRIDSSNDVSLVTEGLQLRFAELSSDGRSMLVITKANPNEVLILTLSDGKTVCRLLCSQSSELSLDWREAHFSPDGNRVLAIAGNEWIGVPSIWDTRNGAEIGFLQYAFGEGGGRLHAIAFSEDGTSIIGVNDNSVFTWDGVSGGYPKTRFRIGSDVVCTAISRDGSMVVCGTESEEIVLLSFLRGGTTLLLRSRSLLDAAVFAPDGQRVVTCGKEGSITIWDCRSGLQLWSVDVGSGGVHSVEFNSSGERLLAVLADGSTQIWDVALPPGTPPTWMISLSESLAGRWSADGYAEITEESRKLTLPLIRDRIGESSQESNWYRWGKWLTDDPARRSISPLSQMSLTDYVSRQLLRATPSSRSNAMEAAIGMEELSRKVADDVKSTR